MKDHFFLISYVMLNIIVSSSTSPSIPSVKPKHLHPRFFQHYTCVFNL